MRLQNTDCETRVWPGLQTVDGHTLELAPGDVDDVAVDELPDDPWLRPVAGEKEAGGSNPRGRGTKAASQPEDASAGVSDQQESAIPNV